MKQKIKDFFTQKRCKKLLNNKGFSLLEVLVAVSIIGIISAIAIPQFADQRENAAKVASDTSASNIAKAFQNCVVLNSFGSCNSLTALKIACPAGSTCGEGGTNPPNFCAHIKRGTANQDDFNVCVSVNATTGTVSRTYGGALLNYEICHKAVDTCGTPTNNVTKEPVAGLKKCTTGNSSTVCGAAASAPDADGCITRFTCEKPNNQTGDCDATAGTCS